MNMLDAVALANWAEERGISYEEAFAIFKRAEDDDDAERIYQQLKRFSLRLTKQKESPSS